MAFFVQHKIWVIIRSGRNNSYSYYYSTFQDILDVVPMIFISKNIYLRKINGKRLKQLFET